MNATVTFSPMLGPIRKIEIEGVLAWEIDGHFLRIVTGDEVYVYSQQAILGVVFNTADDYDSVDSNIQFLIDWADNLGYLPDHHFVLPDGTFVFATGHNPGDGSSTSREIDDMGRSSEQSSCSWPVKGCQCICAHAHDPETGNLYVHLRNNSCPTHAIPEHTL